MATLLGKSCSPSALCLVPFFDVFMSFPYDVMRGILTMTVCFHDHCPFMFTLTRKSCNIVYLNEL